MTRLNWDKSVREQKYKQARKEGLLEEVNTKTPRITNEQKKHIAILLRTNGQKCYNDINNMTRGQASRYIQRLQANNQ